MEKISQQQMDSTNLERHYYTIYFPAFSAADEIFLSTDKKELEKYYANYLIEEHPDEIYDRTVSIHPTLEYSKNEFEKHLTTLPPNEVLLLDGCYVKEINYPHLHILVENKNGEKLELGEIAIADTEFDMVQLVNKENLTIEYIDGINSCLQKKGFYQIPYTEFSTKIKKQKKKTIRKKVKYGFEK